MKATAPLASNERIDQYEVLRLLGEGATSCVYLARDLELGRKVALKVFRAEYASRFGHEELTREARALAQLDHPAIARVWSTGSHRGRPYFALEYVEGAPLREVLRQQRLSAAEATRLVATVAQALDAAHRTGLSHGDIKPENVLLARDGQVRVIDLGLARPLRIDSEPELALSGTPSYLAPECFRGAAPGAAADLWALGVLWFECIVGQRPYAGTAAQLPSDFGEGAFLRLLRPHLEGPLARIEGPLQRLLSPAPQARPSAGELAAELEALLRRPRAGPPGAQPFRGLEPYGREQAHLFFGRDREISELRRRLLASPLVAVVGPSGVGKSSLVMAGLAPLLEEDGALPSVVLRPGSDPLRALERAVARDSSVSLVDGGGPSAADLADRLRTRPVLLGQLLRERCEAHGRRLLLVVDQAEELFTLTRDDSDRLAAARALLGAADDPTSLVRVVLTLRDDFLCRAAELPELALAVERGLFLLRPPTPAALRDVVARSLEPFGYALEDPALLEDMLSAVKDQVGALPLLQFAAARLWEARDQQRRVLTRAAYEAFGGVAGALADHAQTVLQGMPPAVAVGARQLLLRLVTPEGTRACVDVESLHRELGPDAAAALRRLVEARLLQQQRDADERDTVELVHESLVTRWAALRRWREESRADLELERFVRTAAARWSGAGRRAIDRLRGDSLEEARAWRARQAVVPPELDAFLEASGEGERGRRAFRRRLRLGALGALSLVALVSLAAAVLVSREAERSKLSERQAVSSLATALVQGAEAALERDDPLEARAKLRAALEAEDSVPARALWRRLESIPLLHRVARDEMFYAVAFSPRGDALATGGSAGRVRFVDLTTGRETFLGDGHEVGILDLRFDGAGRLLVAGGGGRVMEWEPEPWKSTVLFEVPKTIAWRVALSPGERFVAACYADGSVFLRDRRSGTSRLLGRHRGGARGVAFLDEDTLVSGGDDGLRRWNVREGEGEPVAGIEAISSLAAHGPLVGLGFQSGRLGLWDSRTGARRTFLGHAREVRSVAFDPKGRWLASGGWDGQRLWNLERSESTALPGHGDGVYGLAFDAPGARLASASVDRSVRVVDPSVAETQRSSRHTDRIHGVAFSRDGSLLVSASADRTVRLWHTPTGVSRQLSRSQASIASVGFDPLEPQVFISGQDGTVQRIDVETGEVDELPRTRGLHFGPDGRSYASIADGLLTVKDRAGRALMVASGPPRAFSSLGFSGDGKRLVSTERDGSVRVWDARSGASELMGVHPAGGHGVSFHPSGRWVASGGGDGTVRLWTVSTRAESAVLEADARSVWVVRFSHDGDLLGANGDRCAVTLWDTRDLAAGPPPRLRCLGEGIGANELDFSRTGLVAASSDQDTVRVWRTDGAAHWRAPVLLPLEPACVAWPDVSSEEQEIARRAALGHELDRRPRSCAGRVPEGSELDRCLRAASGVARRSPDGRHFALRCDGWVEAFDAASSSRVARVASSGDFAVLNGGLALLEDGALRVRGFGEAADAWGRAGAGPVAAGPDLVAALVDGQLWELDARTGQPRRELARPDRPLSALCHAGEGWVGGSSSGEVWRWHPEASRARRRVFASSPVSALAAAGGLVAVGHRSGALALWLPEHDHLAFTDRLHGSVVALHLDGEALLAVSELGDWRRVELGAFRTDWCSLVRDVWSKVPARWQDGTLQVAAPGPEHPCRR